MQTFGRFFQLVMQQLRQRHDWDDPYGTLASDVGETLLTLIHEQFTHGGPVDETAQKVHQHWLDAPI